jgi:TolB-like protein/Tfp pilus assembly protein PilF
MIGQTLGHYRVLEQIGAGGMGLVFRAHDERLGRDVALKVLPPGTLADENARRRFRKEALTLSKLNHPNIETVFDFDTQDGVDFLVMELIPGVTLDEKLAAGALPEKEVIRLGTQLAEGLAAAHAEGVIHRDLKPGNLRLTPDGRLKILDFGLAKLLHPVSDAAPTESLRQTNGAVGTLPYMAPEQLRGEPADARSDIWAAGAALHEMATGRRPFPQTSAPMLTDAILRQAPVPPRAVNANLSTELERIISKSLDKDAEHRYQSAKELGVDLRRLGTPLATVVFVGAPKPAWQSQVRYVIPVAGMAAILMVASAFVWNVEGFRDRLLGRASAPSAPRIESLAVLPLANLSGDPQQEYFADGMTEELTTSLAQVSALRVISRTSVLQYKGTKKPLPQIARELNVDAVVEGSVLRAGDRVRITAQLIRAAADEHLWAQSYDRSLGDVLGLQSEVARDIAQEVKAKLTPQEQTRLTQARAVDSEVHDLYLKGRYHLSQATEKEIRSGLQYFQQAVDKDPNFAPGYVGVAASYASLSTNYMAPRQVMPQARAAALKALELDENLAEAHAWLGFVSTNFDWDAQAAERELRRAVEMNPSSADAHRAYASYLSAAGRHEQAIAEARRAQELDPLANPSWEGLCWLLIMARQYDSALTECQKAMERVPDFGFAHGSLGLAYAEKGRFSEAVAEAQRGARLDDSPVMLALLAQVQALAGQRREALTVLDDLKRLTKRRYVCSYEVAAAYVALGDKEEAFRWFDKGVEDRSDCMVTLAVDPRLDSIRSDPRYGALVRRVGFAK